MLICSMIGVALAAQPACLVGGSWVLVSVEEKGEVSNDHDLTGAVFTFGANRLKIAMPDQGPGNAEVREFELTLTGDRTLDFRGVAGTDAAYSGIWMQADGRLSISYCRARKKLRPTAFTTVEPAAGRHTPGEIVGILKRTN